jgi:hypothetical protein
VDDPNAVSGDRGHPLDRLGRDISRTADAIIRWTLLLSILAFPVAGLAAVGGQSAVDAALFMLGLAWWKQRRGGTLPAFFADPTRRGLVRAVAIGLALGGILTLVCAIGRFGHT